MILAQALGEYAGAGELVANLIAVMESGVQWLQFSVQANPVMWFAGAGFLLFGYWLTRRT